MANTIDKYVVNSIVNYKGPKQRFEDLGPYTL